MFYELGVTEALSKYGSASREMKEYHRAIQLLRKLRPGQNAPSSTEGTLFHGIGGPGSQGSHETTPMSRARDILRSKQLLPTQEGTHGSGVYNWHDFPLLTYMNNPKSVGLAMDKAAVPQQRQPPDLNPHVHKDLRPRMAVLHSPEGSAAPIEGPALPFDIPLSKHTTLIAPKSEITPEIAQLLRQNRIRHIDSAIFHRAEADLRARADPELRDLAVTPNKRELRKFMKEPHTFKNLRGSNREPFQEDYANLTALTSGEKE